MCASSESSGETLKCAGLFGFVVTNSHVLTDKLYKHTSSLFGPVDDTWTCICSTSTQKAELKVVGVWVRVLVCTWRAAFEMDWWSIGVF